MVQHRGRFPNFRPWLFSMACAMAILLALPGYGQSPAVPEASPSMLQTLEQLAPGDLQNLLPRDSGVSTAPVQLDGRRLFWVAAPATAATEQGTLSASQRAEEIQQRLRRIAEAAPYPSQLEVQWTPEDNGRQPILYVGGELLMTVTSLDAQLEAHNSLTLRASQLQTAIQSALERYETERQPEHFWQQLRQGAAALLLLSLLHCGLAAIRARLRHRRRQLAASEETSPAPSNVTTGLRNRCLQREQRGWIDFQRATLKLLQLGAWWGGIYYVLGLFPQSRWLQGIMLDVSKLPVRITVLLIVTYWLVRLSNRVIDRVFLTIEENSGLAVQPHQRLGLRFSTFAQVSKSVAAFLLLLAAAIATLAFLGVRVGPLLTGAGLVGLAFSLASQSLIQDFINGFLILLEDQYGVGDVIVVDQVSGFVETMNLRTTQLRNEEGRLITIPNSKIAVVQNLSKEWARVDLMVPIALHSDIDAALALVEREASQMQQESIWGQLILEPPLLLGVDQLNHGGATIRLWIKTLPLKQWDVARELRRRLKIALEKADIALGVPQQIVHMQRPKTSPQAAQLVPDHPVFTGSSEPS